VARAVPGRIDRCHERRSSDDDWEDHVTDAAGTAVAGAPDLVRVARAMDVLRAGVDRQPTVGEVAAELHVSEAHLRRMFARWAGVSPKRYLQHLTALRGRELLREDRPVLAAAYEAGLSSGGRLHDLLVSVEALTPGEVGADGAGATLRAGVHDTPLGRATVATTERGICALRFHPWGEDRVDEVAGEWPAARLIRDDAATAAAASLVAAALGASLGRDPVRLVVRGTNLQVQVWRALLAIPPGQVHSYSDIARAVGRPAAVRGVANAIARNPIGMLIPCHRVLRASGDLAGYRWGVDRKRALLAAEQAVAAEAAAS
jgi:AraC family transcriptional regulator of adaptative response/methylated-DNA-[protein]-cysteine methyltransferase